MLLPCTGVDDRDQQELAPILAGYDGSPASRRALAYAAAQAEREGRPLLLAHIEQDATAFDGGFGWPTSQAASSELLEWLREEATSALDTANLDVQFVETSGNAARRIAELAAEHHAATIVLGAPEHRLHHLIGSVPAWLARHACCPVIIVP